MLMRFFNSMFKNSGSFSDAYRIKILKSELDAALYRINTLTAESNRVHEETVARNADHAAEITRLSESNKNKQLVLDNYRKDIQEKSFEIERLKLDLEVSQGKVEKITSMIEEFAESMKAVPKECQLDPVAIETDYREGSSGPGNNEHSSISGYSPSFR